MLDNCINFGMDDEDPTMTRLAVRESQIKNAINGTAHTAGNAILDKINLAKAHAVAHNDNWLHAHGLTDIKGSDAAHQYNVEQAKAYFDLDKNKPGYDALATKVGYGAMAGAALGTAGAGIAAEQLAQGALHGTGLARRLAISKAAKSNAIGSYNKSIGKLETKKSEYLTDGKKVSGIDKKINKLTKVRDNISDKLNAKVDSDISTLRTKLAVAKSRGDTVTVARITRKLADLQTNYK